MWLRRCLGSLPNEWVIVTVTVVQDTQEVSSGEPGGEVEREQVSVACFNKKKISSEL